MVSVVLSLLLITALALAVVGVVAVPARRAGRRVLTRRGASALDTLRERTTPARTPEERPQVEADEDAPVPLSA